MKLGKLFPSLTQAVDLMGAEKRGKFNIEFVEKHLDKVDVELAEGKDVELSDINVDSGLLSYEGRQILLYIKDHGQQFESAMSNPKKFGRKYHVADCSTLKSMREGGRFERYVATNDSSGQFLISGNWGEGLAELAVCQNCLKALNYKGWNTGENKGQILRNFHMAEFFQTYSSFFPHMPKRKAEDATEGYTDDWAKISSHYRVEHNFICEECGVNLRTNRNLVHVHHINGVKSDNHESNLKALCLDCHSKQNFHEHMCVTQQERQIILDKRIEQGLLRDSWDDIISYADPAVSGILYACKNEGFHKPDLNYYLRDDVGGLGARFDLAWPQIHFAVAINPVDIEDGIRSGWQVISAAEFLTNYKSQGRTLRY